MHKDKIEGAYLLIKRLKNRLKGFDEVIKRIGAEKANLSDFKDLQHSIAKERTQSIFEDMKRLFDTTVEQFDRKVKLERVNVAKSYESILDKQRKMILAFEMKYNGMINKRLDTLENALAELQTDQVRLISQTGTISKKLAVPDDWQLDEHGLYPTQLSSYQAAPDKIFSSTSYDSVIKDQNVLNISKTIMDMRTEQALTQRQMTELS